MIDRATGAYLTATSESAGIVCPVVEAGHTFAMPRREFVNGEVHFAGPFKRHGVPLTLCGVTGMEKDQLRVRRPLTCPACEKLAWWVWSHRRPYGFRDARPNRKPAP